MQKLKIFSFSFHFTHFFFIFSFSFHFTHFLYFHFYFAKQLAKSWIPETIALTHTNMEYTELECKEVLTLESMASEMTRKYYVDHNYALESLLNNWKQWYDATAIAEEARKMLDACASPRGTEDICMEDLDAARFDNLFDDLDGTGFSDFYGAGDEDPPRAAHEDLWSGCLDNVERCGCAARASSPGSLRASALM